MSEKKGYEGKKRSYQETVVMCVCASPPVPVTASPTC